MNIWEYWIKNRFNRFIKKHNFSSKDISVITLNYTNTLEKILTSVVAQQPKVLIVVIHYVILSTFMVYWANLSSLGVDNETQIKNEEVKKMTILKI